MTRISPDAFGPVFISYRQSDGTDITAELAWLLRAAGIPVWRDKDDLPPGDTTERLEQAIGEGLAGAVLVITPEIEKSTVVKKTEAPLLVRLHAEHPEFALGIANAVEREPGKIDYGAPDRLLNHADPTLASVDQHPTTRAGILVLVQKLLAHRIAQTRASIASEGGTFNLNIQTRNTPQVYDRTGSHLDVRIRPSTHERLPSVDGLRDLADTIRYLPDSVTRSGANRVRITGGAHLSVAFAIGASLPSSRIGHMDVIDQRGETWASDGEARMPERPLLAVTSQGTNATVQSSGRPSVAVYLDLLPQRSDAAFERYLDECRPDIAAWQHLTYAVQELLDPATAGEVAAEAAHRIRSLANDHRNAEVHLLLRCPYPITLLVARLTNTLRIVPYEWDDSDPAPGDDDYRARYVPTVRVRTSAVDGVIQQVTL
ncbi:SAVED domain-containing protein [Nocardioides sp.]|uniref:SAVED domain-containing protein n=1 Tax=Nocardioides sp. TaxID=35761 RepID=UPI0025F0695C|nr:SAVED domain-containing protein [Nocardioides sp.]